MNKHEIRLTANQAVLELNGWEWTAPLKDLEVDDPTQIPLLPPQVRWFSADQKAWLLEFPPRTHTVTLVPNGMNVSTTVKTQQEVDIPVPWTVYFVDLEHHYCSIFARPAQIRTLDDKLSWHYLSNIKEDHHFCEGFRTNFKNSQTPLQKVMTYINDYWKTGFNGGHYLMRPDTKKFLPTNLIREERIKGSGYGIFIDLDFYLWVSTLSHEDVLAWEWVEDMSVGDLIKRHQAAKRQGLWERLDLTIRTKGNATQKKA